MKATRWWSRRRASRARPSPMPPARRRATRCARSSASARQPDAARGRHHRSRPEYYTSEWQARFVYNLRNDCGSRTIICGEPASRHFRGARRAPPPIGRVRNRAETPRRRELRCRHPLTVIAIASRRCWLGALVLEREPRRIGRAALPRKPRRKRKSPNSRRAPSRGSSARPEWLNPPAGLRGPIRAGSRPAAPHESRWCGPGDGEVWQLEGPGPQAVGGRADAPIERGGAQRQARASVRGPGHAAIPAACPANCSIRRSRSISSRRRRSST